MTAREHEIDAWRRSEFPRAGEWDIFKKLTEEVGELAEAMAGGSLADVCHEAADCKIVLENLLSFFGESLHEHSRTVWAKRRDR